MGHGEIQRRLRWLPNALTIGRLLALPVLVWVVWQADGPTDALAAWMFAAVAITDLLDGFLARRLDAVTTFGRLADPFADRVLVAVGLWGLIVLGRVHPAGPIIIFTRDIVSVIAALALRGRGIDMRVDLLGKTSSALVMAAVALALLSTATWIDWLFWVSVCLSLVAFSHYAVTVLRRLRVTSSQG